MEGLPRETYELGYHLYFEYLEGYRKEISFKAYTSRNTKKIGEEGARLINPPKECQKKNTLLYDPTCHALSLYECEVYNRFLHAGTASAFHCAPGFFTNPQDLFQAVWYFLYDECGFLLLEKPKAYNLWLYVKVKRDGASGGCFFVKYR